MKWTFLVLSAKNNENPDSGGPNEYSKPSSTIAFNAPPDLDFFKPKKFVDMMIDSILIDEYMICYVALLDLKLTPPNTIAIRPFSTLLYVVY